MSLIIAHQPGFVVMDQPPSRNLAEQFKALWASGQTPDAFEFLQQHADARPREIVEVLLVDQEHRWNSDSGLSVAEYLDQRPEFGFDEELVLELLAGQYRCRGEEPDLAEVASRLTGISESRLRELLYERVDISAEIELEPTVTQPAASEPDRPTGCPERIGRYLVLSLLGDGGFGSVYLAMDEELARKVAIKVPRPERVSSHEDIEAFLTEARVVAGLDHPHIVPVYDVVRTDDGLCFVVSKFIEGCDLKKQIRNARPTHDESAALIVPIAEALHYAHTQGVVHRDIKPANILVDASGTPHLADFGLALKEEDFGKGPEFAGTIQYMSPEQARGEGHRVHGCSDIFSLGVVLYELLTGKRPFEADGRDELLDRIRTVEVRPPRQRDDEIPLELERICLKALSKRALDRYTTAKDMAGDLRAFLQNDTASPTTAVHDNAPVANGHSSVKIVPKGLRAFDAGDANFFLELVPGPRDRHGLPESIRFWKSRIDETDADETFAVGLMYGPSGCGKSSLMKAGLLPRLAEHVLVVYLEATADETEARLLAALRKRCPRLTAHLDLKQTLAALRRGKGLSGGKKVVIILDQFEQWLHAKQDEQESELIQALRQCDGGSVQCLVMVRDDFWMAATRFMRELENRLVEGHNSAAVDLFDVDHARNVLAAFGRALGRLPEDASVTTNDQEQFLCQAVDELAEDGKVVCVHVALFAEMMKGRPWTPASLMQVGGTAGVGVTFLEETFSASTAPPAHRHHQKAARAVLETLLPADGTNIKGHMRSYEELLEVSGYSRQPQDFNELIQILDREVRLITPTDLSGVDTGDDSPPPRSPGQRHYQLTHDYLVPSLREWLTRKQKETWRGRAELRLAERAAQWSRTKERRFLPSLPEYVSIVCGVPAAKRTPPQRELMRAATRHHTLRWGSLLAVVLLVTFAVERYVSYSRAGNLRREAVARVDTLLKAPPAEVPDAIRDLEKLQELALPVLREKFASNKSSANQRLHAAFSLMAFGQLDDEYLDFLISQMGNVSAAEYRNIQSALRQARDRAKKKLLAQVKQASDAKSKSRLAILLLYLGDESGAAECVSPAADPKTHMIDPTTRTTFLHEVFPSWQGDPSRLAEMLKTTRPCLRFVLCLGLGLTPEKRLSADHREQFKPMLLELYRTAPDGPTHSAARWTLRQWKVPLPTLKPERQPNKTRDWWFNTLGMTLLKVPAGRFSMGESPGQPVTLNKPFWLSGEVTVAQFQQFARDTQFKNYPDKARKEWAEEFEKFKSMSPEGNCPVHSVTWHDAILFCNWLSHREGKLPCYKKAGDEWTLDPQGTGYRLPSEAQWEYACRAGAKTEFCYGDDESLLRGYAVYNTFRTSTSGSKLPNAWGLHDMHGNVYEWCSDWHQKHLPGGTDQQVTEVTKETTFVYFNWFFTPVRVNRGGSWSSDTVGAFRAAYRSAGPSNYRSNSLGFRVVAVQLSQGAAE